MAYDKDELARVAREMYNSGADGDIRKAIELTGLHRATVYDIIRGDRIGMGSFEKFAKGLGGDPEPLLIAAGYKERVPPDDLIRRYVRAQRGKADPETLKRNVLKILDEEMAEPEGYEPEL